MLRLSNVAVIIAAFAALSACSASAQEDTDASNLPSADARDPIVFPDGAPPIFPDAMPQVDAMPACPDDNEPNDTQGAPSVLTDINDCDGNGDSVTGKASTGDEDWFSFNGEDVGGCSVDPSVVITGNVQVCMFFLCGTGTTEVTCPVGTTEPGGGPIGCCGTDDFSVELNCVGPISDDAAVSMQVTSTEVGTCEDYTVAYHY